MEPGATPPVDIFPFLNYLPERLFNNWRTRCSNVGRAMDKLYGGMVTRVKARRLRSGSKDSFLDNVLDQQDKLQFSSNELNMLCGVLMEGGSDTSSSIILAFIHAMLKYPDVQKEAQREIDGVMGEERSPVWADFGKLPYVNMIVKETMRWRPVTPLAFPHATSEGTFPLKQHSTTLPSLLQIFKSCSSIDGMRTRGSSADRSVVPQADTINNFTIPAKTTVFINTYGLHHAPVSSTPTPSSPSTTTLPSPSPSPHDQAPLSTFQPPRHLPIALRSAPDLATSPNHHLRDHYGYGSGRRLCPGIHLAERNLWLAVAKLCWAFEFKEGEGGVVDADYRTGYSEGFLVCAREFGCEVVVRGEGRRETILREMREVEGGVFVGLEDE